MENLDALGALLNSIRIRSDQNLTGEVEMYVDEMVMK